MIEKMQIAANYKKIRKVFSATVYPCSSPYPTPVVFIIIK
jgi:hypothetical protein